MANEKHRIMTIKYGPNRSEVHILNPGDCFDGFGGSSRGLVVRKTASLIVREVGPSFGLNDTEYNVNDKKAWARIAKQLRTEGVEVVTYNTDADVQDDEG